MRNQILINLLEKLNSKGIELDKSDLERIQNLELARINILSKITSKKNLTSIIDLLKTQTIKSINVLEAIVKIIDKAPCYKSGYLAALAAQDKEIYNYMDLKHVPFIRYIANADSDRVDDAISAAKQCIKSQMAPTKVCSITNLVAHAKTKEQANMALDVLKTNSLTTNQKSVDLIDSIVNAKNKDSAQYATNAIFDTYVVDDLSNDFEEIIKVIANSKDSRKAKVAFDYLSHCDYDDEDLLSIIKVFVNAKDYNRAQIAYDIAMEKVVRTRNLQLPLARSVANARSESRAGDAYYAAINSANLQPEFAKKITKLIAQANSDKQAALASHFISNYYCNEQDIDVIKAITKTDFDVPTYTTMNSNNVEAALSFFKNSDDNEEKTLSLFLNVLFDGDDYIKFIDYYEKDPKGALEALKDVTKTCNQEFDTGKTYVKNRRFI